MSPKRDFWMENKSEAQKAICEFCCCECIDSDDRLCCHTTEMGDCDCHLANTMCKWCNCPSAIAGKSDCECDCHKEFE